MSLVELGSQEEKAERGSEGRNVKSEKSKAPHEDEWQKASVRPSGGQVGGLVCAKPATPRA